MGIVDTLINVLGPVREYILTRPILTTFTIIILAFLIAFFILYVLKHYVRAIIKKAKSKVSEKVLNKIQNPLAFLIILIGFEVALERLIVTRILLFSFIESLIIVVITYVTISVSDVILEVWGRNYTRKKGAEFNEEILPLAKGTTKLIIGLLGLLFVLESWGIEVGPLLLSLGLAGAILGFSLKDTLSNIFGGIALILDKDFHLGDVIELDSGEVGEVTEISLRSTRIKTYDNLVTIIPNSLLSTTKFKNYAKPTQTVRVSVPINIAYGTSPHEAEEVLLGALRDNPHILKYPKREIRYTKLGDYGIEYNVLFFVSDYHKRFDVKNQVTKDLYDAIYKHGLTIPYPTRTLYKGKKRVYKPKKRPT